MIPSLPAWDGLHPLVIHFPIALLLVAPILVVLGLLFQKQWPGFAGAAFTLMLLGTVGAFVAVSTGEAGAELADRAGGVAGVLERHEELAETTRTIFTVLTCIFAAITFAPLALRMNVKPVLRAGLNVAFLCLYTFGVLMLVNTAHQGGRLVHEFGVQAMIESGTADAAGEREESHEEVEHEGGEEGHER